ncbi:glycosyltransferase, partial [Vibrio hyugaensis]|uniref:glycosyltransferase n=1 Tax=Vibrio hyugaensis TaxID=1534743 RepID=UPI000CE51AA8
MEKISVIMSIYNEPIELIKKAIDSILRQTYSEFEFLIVNDNPDRKSNAELLQFYNSRDSRVLPIYNENNIGLTKSLNKAVFQSSGDYIARMDADDISDVNRFQKQISFFKKNNDVHICATFVKVIDKFDNELDLIKSPTKDLNIKSKLFFRNCISHPTVMYRREMIIDLGGYTESVSKAQDYDLWVRALISGYSFHIISEPLLKYRVHDNNISTIYINEQDAFASKAKLNLHNNFISDGDVESFVRQVDSNKKIIGLIRGFSYLIRLSFNIKKRFPKFNRAMFICNGIKRIL